MCLLEDLLECFAFKVWIFNFRIHLEIHLKVSLEGPLFTFRAKNANYIRVHERRIMMFESDRHSDLDWVAYARMCAFKNQSLKRITSHRCL